MSGLTQRNQAGQSGLVAPKIDFQRFTGSATYTKPGDVSIIWIECYGGGGGGGGGVGSGSTMVGGAGGGGGAMSWACFSADALPSTLDVVVGATANGGAGGSSGSGSVGTAGNHSQVDIPSGETDANKVILIAYGGGGGGLGGDGQNAGGGGGGGSSDTGTPATGGLGGRGEIRIYAI